VDKSLSFFKSVLISPFFQALVVTFVISLPRLLSYAEYGPFTQALYDDWDEPLYLSHFLRLGSEFVNVERSLNEWLQAISIAHQAVVPHVLVDLFLGKLFSLLQFEAVEVALTLDILCTYFSFLAAYFLFSSVFSPSIAFAASAVLLLVPWLINIELLLPLNISFPISRFRNEIFGNFPSVPMHRAVYTQLSYPVVLLSLSLFCKALLPDSNRGRSKSRAFYGGLLAGLTLYLYFFSSIATVLLAACVILVLGIVEPRFFYSRWVPLGFHFVAAAILVSLPGVLFVLASGQSEALRLPDIYRWIVNCSPVRLTIAGLSIYAIKHWARDPHMRVYFCLLPAAYLAIFFAGLLQPIKGALLTIYHFPVFYYFPIAGAACVLLLLQLGLSGRVRLLGTLVIIVFSIATYFLSALPFPDDDELRELTLYLKERNETGRFEFFPYQTLEPQKDTGLPMLFIAPYVLSSFTYQKFQERDSFFLNARRVFEVELAQSMLYRGRAEPFYFCPDVSLPKVDLYNSPFGFLKLKRAEFCEQQKIFAELVSPCEVAKAWKKAPVVWWEMFGEPAAHLRELSSEVWRSAGGRYHVFWINKARFVYKVCHSEPVRPSNSEGWRS